MENQTHNFPAYRHIPLRDEITVDSFVNAARVEVPRHFVFEGERHDFWELQYAAKGSFFVFARGQFRLVFRGQLILFAPGQLHVLYGTGQAPAEAWVYSFRCGSRALLPLDQRSIDASPAQHRLMEGILTEAEANFCPSHVAGQLLEQRPRAAFGCEQLIKNRVEELLLLLTRSGEQAPGQRSRTLAEAVRGYLQEHLHQSPDLTQLAAVFGVSVTYVKRVYRTRYGCSIMADFHRMKMERAESLLAADLPVGVVALRLGFEDPCYFSKCFKRHTGRTPTAYRAGLPEP